MAVSSRSLGQLVADATADIRSIVEHEKALAKVEVGVAAKAGGIGAGLLIAAVSVIGLGSVFLLIAAAEALIAADLPRWAGFLIVGGALVVLAVVLGLVGARSLKRVRGPVRTMSSAKAVIADVRTSLARTGPSDATIQTAKTTLVTAHGTRNAGRDD